MKMQSFESAYKSANKELKHRVITSGNNIRTDLFAKKAYGSFNCACPAAIFLANTCTCAIGIEKYVNI